MIKNILVENGLWSKESDDKVESLKKDIDILKIEIFKNYLQESNKGKLKTKIMKSAKNQSISHPVFVYFH